MTNNTRIYPSRKRPNFKHFENKYTLIHKYTQLKPFLPSYFTFTIRQTRTKNKVKQLEKIDWNKLNTNQVRVKYIYLTQ